MQEQYLVTWTRKDGKRLEQVFTSRKDAEALQADCVRQCRYDVRLIVQRFGNMARLIRVSDAI